MAGTKKDTSTVPKCTCCGCKLDSYVSRSEFYKSTHQLPFCKNCVDNEFERLLKRFNYEVDKSIYYLCMKIDMPFYINVLEGAKKEVEKTNGKLNRIYITKINSFRDKNGYGDSFLDGEQLSSHQITLSDESNKELDKDLVKFWGQGFNSFEYEYLQDFFEDFVNNYECDSPTQILLFKNAAKTQLNADKALSDNNISLYNSLMKTLSSILGDSNIKPNQESGANAAEQATFGTLLKKWENEEPVPEPDEEWKDVDGIGKYIRIWFLGHLCKMMGITNDYSKEYEEEMAKLRVNLPSNDILSEDMDEGD